MIKAFSRGHEIIFVNGKWLFSDTRLEDDGSRPCKRCGKEPTDEGHDACLGRIEGMSSACCGHGSEKPYFVEFILNEKV